MPNDSLTVYLGAEKLAEVKQAKDDKLFDPAAVCKKALEAALAGRELVDPADIQPDFAQLDVVDQQYSYDIHIEPTVTSARAWIENAVLGGWTPVSLTCDVAGRFIMFGAWPVAEEEEPTLDSVSAAAGS